MIRCLDIYNIGPIVDTLEELQLFQDFETSSKALNILYRSITTS